MRAGPHSTVMPVPTDNSAPLANERSTSRTWLSLLGSIHRHHVGAPEPCPETREPSDSPNVDDPEPSVPTRGECAESAGTGVRFGVWWGGPGAGRRSRFSPSCAVVAGCGGAHKAAGPSGGSGPRGSPSAASAGAGSATRAGTGSGTRSGAAAITVVRPGRLDGGQDWTLRTPALDE
jgi:hypothetical protein